MLPEPYYQDESCTLYLGDCREILPRLATASVDLVLTDPPYPGMQGGYERGPGGVGRKHRPSVSLSGTVWESGLDWVDDAWRVSRCGFITFCSYHSVAEVAALLPAESRVALLTWYKRNAAPSGANVPRHTTELIWAFRKRVGLKWDALTTTMFDIPNINAGVMATERIVDRERRAIHPTQKPIELIRSLLTVGGDVILDPFVGTGTTLRAAKDLGRKAIGIEIDPKYADIAARRLAQAVLPLEVTA